MHIVVFGLTVSSSWGNGHATLWRSLIRALVRAGHTVCFFEKDVPYYADNRDLTELPEGARLILYRTFAEVETTAKSELRRADLALCTSFCPDGVLAARLILGAESRNGALIRAFYDLDTPVTLLSLGTARVAEYLPADGLAQFDLVLSYTGGRALEELSWRLGAREVAAFYGWVDPELHKPVPPVARFRSSLSYLGTYATDRQAALTELFLGPASQLPQDTFLIGGAQYPEDFPWAANISFAQHLEPAQHAAFFCSSRTTLNITRQAMAEYGYCPSGRLFEAAACGVPILTDGWEGLESFFAPGVEILRVDSGADVLQVLSLSDAELQRVAEAGRSRALRDHTADQRVRELETLCDGVRARTRQTSLRTEVPRVA